jgi:hypothetical protein
MLSLDGIKKNIARNWASYLVIAIAVLAQLWIISRPFTYLITSVIPDDAFYYFQIARNIVTGHGITFDGINPTNGFHPLWLVLLVGIYSLFSTGGTFDIAPIHVALSLSVLFNALTACFVFAVISRVTQHPGIRTFALALWALNPFILFESLNGLETSLALFLTSVFIYCALVIRDRGSLLQYAFLGIPAGLMILARLDMAFYLIAFLGWLFVMSRTNITRILVVGIIATVIVSPWIVWNYTHFGMVLTSASEANTLVNKTLIAQDNGSSVFQLVKGIIYNVDGQIRLLMTRTGSPAFLLVIVGAALVLMLQKRLTFPQRLRDIRPELAFFLGFCLLFFANVVLRFGGRTWYFVTFGFFVSLFFAITATAVVSEMKHKKIVAAVFGAFILFAFYVAWSKDIRNQYVSAEEIYAVTEWSNAHLPPDAVIGAFNSGIQGYFTRNRVVNLDGLVNNAAFEALEQKQVWNYLQSAGVTYVIDYDIYITYRYKSFLGIPDPLDQLELVDRVALVGHSRSQNGISIYKVKGK